MRVTCFIRLNSPKLGLPIVPVLVSVETSHESNCGSLGNESAGKANYTPEEILALTPEERQRIVDQDMAQAISVLPVDRDLPFVQR